MFCRNCGKELTGAQDFCIYCGAKPMDSTNFCPECGTATTPLTETCNNCGAQVAEAITRRTWMPRAAGVLAIVVGAVGVTEWVGVAVLGILAWGWLGMGNLLGLGGIITTVVTSMIIIGVVAIIGGVFSLKRRRWGLALAGSICAFFSFFFIPVLLNVPLAIAAIVLVVMGKREFQ